MKYDVTVHCTSVLTAQVEAKDEDEAWEKARELDGGMFDESEYAAGWEIVDVSPVKGD